MIRDIAEKVAGGGIAIPLLAADLGISQERLLNQLRMMEHMGYLSRDAACTPGEEMPACACCSGCSKKMGDMPTRFTLTEKGRRLIRSQVE